MLIKDTREAYRLTVRREELIRFMHQLNEINIQADRGVAMSVPKDALDFVDQKLAAKGLLSLILESLHEAEEKLESIGVKIDV